MKTVGTYSFVAVDPDGVPRTGKIKAEGATSAERKLKARGFSAIEVKSEGADKGGLKVQPRSSSFRMGRAEKKGYQKSLRETKRPEEIL